MLPTDDHAFDCLPETQFSEVLFLHPSQFLPGFLSEHVQHKSQQSTKDHAMNFRKTQRDDHELRKQVQQSNRKIEVLLKSIQEEVARTKLLEATVLELQISLQAANSRALDVMEENHVIKSQLARNYTGNASRNASVDPQDDHPSSPLERQLFFAVLEDDNLSKISQLQEQIEDLDQKLADSITTITKLNKSFVSKHSSSERHILKEEDEEEAITFQPRRNAVSAGRQSYLARTIGGQDYIVPVEPLTNATFDPKDTLERRMNCGEASTCSTNPPIDFTSSPPSLVSSRSNSSASIKSNSSSLRSAKKLPRSLADTSSNRFMIASHPFPNSASGSGSSRPRRS